MKLDEKLKNHLELMFNWQKENVGQFTEQLVTKSGLTVEIDYITTVFSEDYEFDWNDANPVLTKAQRETLAMIGIKDNCDVIDHLDIDNVLQVHLSELKQEYDGLWQELWTIDRSDEIDIDLDYLYEYDTFDEFVEKNFNENEVEVELTDDYSAILTKGSSIVQVGCQTININTIRALVKEFDELNPNL